MPNLLDRMLYGDLSGCKLRIRLKFDYKYR